MGKRTTLETIASDKSVSSVSIGGIIARLCEPCKKLKRRCLQRFASRTDESCDSCLKSGNECSHKDVSEEVSSPGDEERDNEPLRDVSPSILAELKHLDLSSRVTFSKNVIGSGYWGDICKAYCDCPDGKKSAVVLKRLRFYLRDDVTRLFEKEIYVWSKLHHVNILPLLGYAFDEPTGYPVLVSEWMPQGSASKFLRDNPHFNPTRLVLGIARGLHYLHQQNVVHSDLKPDNVLLTDKLNARICDFGCSRILEASRSLANMSSGVRGTYRYLAYELISIPEAGGRPCHTKETDIWAFGMTVYELLDKKQPYDHCAEFQVPLAILSGQLPSISQPFHDQSPLRKTVKNTLWEICERCWIRNPRDRATIDTILPRFENEIDKHGIPILRSYFYDNEVGDCDSNDARLVNEEKYSLAFLDSIAD